MSDDLCDDCHEQPARFTLEGGADDGSEDEHLCRDCMARH